MASEGQRKVVIAVDGSDEADHAFECKLQDTVGYKCLRIVIFLRFFDLYLHNWSLVGGVYNSMLYAPVVVLSKFICLLINF